MYTVCCAVWLACQWSYTLWSHTIVISKHIMMSIYSAAVQWLMFNTDENVYSHEYRNRQCVCFDSTETHTCTHLKVTDQTIWEVFQVSLSHICSSNDRSHTHMENAVESHKSKILWKQLLVWRAQCFFGWWTVAEFSIVFFPTTLKMKSQLPLCQMYHCITV